MYDLIIIGGGPAGTSSAVYAARKRLKTLLIAKEFGGQSMVSETIYNWIGTPEISGADLAKSLEEHTRYYEGEYLTIKEGQLATKVVKNDDDTFTIITDKEEEFTAKSVLVSSGSSRRKLNVEGADRLEHKGLTYCATCDGPLFADLDVAVIGGGNAGFETAAQLLAYCKSVTLIHRGDSYRADQITVDKVLSHEKMKGITNASLKEIQGEKMVDGLIYTDSEGIDQTLKVQGIFVEIGQIPNTDLVDGVAERDDYNKISIDPWTQKTSQLGIWSAGDCTNVRYHQNNIAAGDAVRAIEDIYSYLHAS
ncbi:MAG: alkyl hydroperoxide reductase subunit F [Flavobacteriaceae bacterium]|jgi:alkyl hydroperoxide reductase subunit F